jgi:hypothetical protein
MALKVRFSLLLYLFGLTFVFHIQGIISALAFSPSYSPDECFYAAGSFTPTDSNIAMFSDAKEGPIMYVGGGPRAGVTQVRCHPGSFMDIIDTQIQLQFNPVKPHLLYAAYRGCGTGLVYSWDIRSDVDTPLEIFQVSRVAKAESDVRTNQKMRFDIDIGGRYLSIGDQVHDYRKRPEIFLIAIFIGWQYLHLRPRNSRRGRG